MEGKIRQDLKLVDSESEVAGIYTIDNNIRAILREKHNQSETANLNVLLGDYPLRVEEVIFEKIDR